MFFFFLSRLGPESNFLKNWYHPWVFKIPKLKLGLFVAPPVGDIVPIFSPFLITMPLLISSEPNAQLTSNQILNCILSII